MVAVTSSYLLVLVARPATKSNGQLFANASPASTEKHCQQNALAKVGGGPFGLGLFNALQLTSMQPHICTSPVRVHVYASVSNRRPQRFRVCLTFVRSCGKKKNNSLRRLLLCSAAAAVDAIKLLLARARWQRALLAMATFPETPRRSPSRSVSSGRATCPAFIQSVEQQLRAVMGAALRGGERDFIFIGKLFGRRQFCENTTNTAPGWQEGTCASVQRITTTGDERFDYDVKRAGHCRPHLSCDRNATQSCRGVYAFYAYIRTLLCRSNKNKTALNSGAFEYLNKRTATGLLHVRRSAANKWQRNFLPLVM